MTEPVSQPSAQLQSFIVNTSQVLQNEQTSSAVLESDGTRKVQDEDLKVKVMLPKIKLVQRLNPQNPADRALAFSLKMINKRKNNQFKMIDSYRKDTKNPEELLGSVSRIIDKQNYMLNHSYLRENHYATIQLTPRKHQPALLPKLPVQEKRRLIQKEIQILNKSKLLSLHYEAKKIVIDILMSVIEKSVDYYLKKSRFYYKPAPKKISTALAQLIVKKNKGNRKGSLTLSRVIDISIPNQQNEDDSESNNRSHDSDDEDSDDEYSDEDGLSKDENDSKVSQSEDQSKQDEKKSSEGEEQKDKRQSGQNSDIDQPKK